MTIESDGLVYPTHPALVGCDLTIPDLQTGLWRLFIEGFHARLSYTGIYRYAPLLFFFVGERREMGQGPLRRRVWDSSSACQWAYPPVGQSGLPTYPLKPSHAVEPGHISLRKSLKSANRFSAQGSEFALLGQPPTAFHEMRRVPTSNPFSQGLSTHCFFYPLTNRFLS